MCSSLSQGLLLQKQGTQDLRPTTDESGCVPAICSLAAVCEGISDSSICPHAVPWQGHGTAIICGLVARPGKAQQSLLESERMHTP